MVFLRLDGDFVSYTPRDKENLHENLQLVQQGLRVESLELAIRREVRWEARGIITPAVHASPVSKSGGGLVGGGGRPAGFDGVPHLC